MCGGGFFGGEAPVVVGIFLYGRRPLCPAAFSLRFIFARRHLRKKTGKDIETQVPRHGEQGARTVAPAVVRSTGVPVQAFLG